MKFTKSMSEFCLLAEKSDPKAHFKISDATLRVKHIKAGLSIYLAHTKTSEQINARYDITKVILKTFTFGPGSKSLSIDNAVLGDLPKRLLFGMVKHSDFTGSVDSNPFNFQQFNLSSFVIYVNGRQIPTEGLNVDAQFEKNNHSRI